VKNAHAARGGRADAYDVIPRLPDRPEALSAYVLPIDAASPEVLSAFDLDRPARAQRQGAGFAEVGHGGVDLAAARGADVRAVALDHQEGSAEVLFAGELFGTTVVTSHLVHEAGRLREYLVILGHLEGVGPAAVPGSPIEPGDVLGGVGDTGSPGNVHLHLEVRQVRDGARLRPVDAHKVVDPALTIACDPRNVLATR
jgi:murein DD-endopeptidase MepM/ murein hydrolase activator NlpD